MEMGTTLADKSSRKGPTAMGDDIDPAEDAYRRTVRTEVAMELINSVRARIYARVYQIENGSEADRHEADRLEEKAIALHRLIDSLDCNEQEQVEAVIGRWGPLLKDRERMWAALQGDHPLTDA